MKYALVTGLKAIVFMGIAVAIGFGAISVNVGVALILFDVVARVYRPKVKRAIAELEKQTS